MKRRVGESKLTRARKMAHGFKQNRSGGDFDLAQFIAQRLTDEDRAKKIASAPRYGYSAENFKIAERAIRLERQ